MSAREVCDRCKRVKGIDASEIYRLDVSLIDPSMPEYEDNVLFYCEMGVCEKCLPIVRTIITERLLTSCTADDVYRQDWEIGSSNRKKPKLVLLKGDE